MFKILIVEDTTDKLRNVLAILKEIPGINIDTIDHEVDAFGAKRKLKNNAYDLLILDIAIPPRREEPIDIEGGIKLLEEILGRQDSYKLPTHIIGLTAKDEDILKKAVKEFDATMLSVIQYSETDLEWQAKLLKGVSQRSIAKNASETAVQTYNYDVAIITAVDCELAAVKALSDNWQKVVYPGDATQYYETVFKENGKELRVVASCATQMGMNASCVLSLKLIYNFRPKYLFMPGIAASIKKSDSHGYGDVIVIDESWDGGAGKITEDEEGNRIFHQTANHLRIDADMAQKFAGLKSNVDLLRSLKDKWKPNAVPNTELSIHIGSVASVAGVIENQAVLEELSRKDRKLLGLEMEAFGVYYSSYNCSNPKPTAVVLKSVTDFANNLKNDIYQPYAAFTSAQVMYHFLMFELD
jgi:nucleoside phosphorylase/DNA-binding NarL/FixJ family response regulator